MKIKRLEFIFRNGDVVSVDGKYVGEIGVRKIKECFDCIGQNDVKLYKRCDEFWVSICKNGDVPYKYGGTYSQIRNFPMLLLFQPTLCH